MNLAHPKSRVPEFRALVSTAAASDSQDVPLFKRWLKHLRRQWRAYEEAVFAPSAFTAVFPLLPLRDAQRAQLLESVAALNEPSSPLQTTPGLCQLRLSLRSAREATPYGALIVDCAHQREREDLLYELFEAHENLLDSVLRHCRDYPGGDVRDACVRQWMRAARDRKVSSSEPCVPIPLDSVPPLHDFEQEVEDERLWLQRAALLSRTSSRKKTREARRQARNATAKRGVHPKHHGLLRAQFTVHENLPDRLAHGVFQAGASYAAWIRLSNMSPEVKPDNDPDARGIAIKLEGVTADEDIPKWQEGAWSGQDFLLASHPIFIFKDVRDYTLFQRIRSDKRRLRGLAFLLARPREAWSLKHAFRSSIDHLLNVEYHSMIPYALGPKVVKYLVRPAAPLASEPVEKKPSSDYLRERLQRTLDPDAQRSVKLEFCLVVPKSIPPSVEDARVLWKSTRATIVPVATIEIQPQDFSEPERMKLAESIEFTPWHTLRAHRPLGSLSRARLAVYRESAGHRRRANSQT